MSNYDLNETCKIVLTQNRCIWNFSTIELLEISRKDRKRALHIENKKIQEKRFEEIGSSY